MGRVFLKFDNGHKETWPTFFNLIQSAFAGHAARLFGNSLMQQWGYLKGLPAINQQDLPSDKPRARVCQKGDDMGDILGLNRSLAR